MVIFDSTAISARNWGIVGYRHGSMICGIVGFGIFGVRLIRLDCEVGALVSLVYTIVYTFFILYIIL